MIGTILKAGKSATVSAIGGLVALIATVDWYAGTHASLGVFYIVPMVIGATVLPASGITFLAIVCSTFRSLFDLPRPPHLEELLRFIFATLAYASSGLLVAALIRNREMTIRHLANLRHEQELRREAEEQLRILAESSPAAILTVDSSGIVLAANRATNALFMIPEGETMKGRPIGAYLPVLTDALQFDPGPEGLRTATQSQGQRENGEVFLANAWFSSYRTPEGMRLAAIVVDSSEEMREREEQSFRHLSEGSRIAAAAVFHEVRNLCGAISVISSNLREKRGLTEDQDFQALTSIAGGLEKIVAVELRSRAGNTLEDVNLPSVLNDLRIVIEPDWLEIDGAVDWQIPRNLPDVLADTHGLLQVFLNLAHNSLRAVRGLAARRLNITAAVEDQKIIVRFVDSGTGVEAPERLFAPFQPGANGTGLGLYVSRAVVRSYGGDLRFEPRGAGACFAVELQPSEHPE
ncbi:MAG TPA: ATP-binding protein [Bryobacteraceae bacterium]|nr:ATP-binding protein [Bryobacteraceae bacterium]